MSLNSARRRRHLILGVGLLVLWICLVTLFRNNLGSPVRIFHDYIDLQDYYLRGSWLPAGAVPYRDVPSEYPQVATFLFGVLYVPFSSAAGGSGVFAQYSMLFSFLMLCLLACLIVLLEDMLPERNRMMPWLLLLPAPLYFVCNRFDVLPSLMVVLAMYLLGREKWSAAAGLLALGTMTKWYPGLLVLPAVRYMAFRKVAAVKRWQFLAVFGMVCVAILAPTYIMGGWKAVLSPYIMYNQDRGFDLTALPALAEPLIGALSIFQSLAAKQWIFLLLQLSAVPLVLFARLDSFERLLSWSLLILVVFTIFSRIYSPQWLLWILPFMILLRRGVVDTALIGLYGTLTYLEFPIVFDGIGLPAMQWIGWTNIVILTLIAIRAVTLLLGRSRSGMAGAQVAAV